MIKYVVWQTLPRTQMLYVALDKQDGEKYVEDMKAKHRSNTFELRTVKPQK